MAIRKPTLMVRATVPQSFRCILAPDTDEGGGLRRVQVLVPQSPTTYAMLAPNPHFVDENGVPLQDLALAAGLDRLYKGVLLTPGAQIVFHISADQSLWAACEEGYSELGIVCEYLKEGL